MKKRKVLIVVDMQNDFVYGSLKNEEAQKIVNNVKNKIEEYKKNCGIVLFTKDTHFTNYLETLEGKKLPVAHCIQNTSGWEIIMELREYCTDENTIIKNTFGYDSWINDLGLEHNIESIELCGVCTDICVISNALILRAIYPNTKMIVDSYCCAGVTIEKHNSALEVMKSCQIDVI